MCTPPTTTMQDFSKFFSSLPDLSSYALILGGDFNCCLDPVLDRSSPKPGIFSKSASTIQSFLLDYGISDVWRCLHSQRREYSFFSHVHHSYSRIDSFFVQNELLPSVRSCTYEPIVISDHAPVTLKMDFLNLPPHRKHWRFNTTLLSDNTFIQFIEEQIGFFFDTNTLTEISSLTVWDTLKAFLRGQIISYTANMKKTARKERQDLASQIKRIDQQCAQSGNKNLLQKRVELQTKFDLLSTYPIEQQIHSETTTAIFMPLNFKMTICRCTTSWII